VTDTAFKALLPAEVSVPATETQRASPNMAFDSWQKAHTLMAHASPSISPSYFDTPYGRDGDPWKVRQ
jgi:hypothetical protein